MINKGMERLLVSRMGNDTLNIGEGPTSRRGWIPVRTGFPHFKSTKFFVTVWQQVKVENEKERRRYSYRTGFIVDKEVEIQDLIHLSTRKRLRGLYIVLTLYLDPVTLKLQQTMTKQRLDFNVDVPPAKVTRSGWTLMKVNLSLDVRKFQTSGLGRTPRNGLLYFTVIYDSKDSR